MIDVLATWAKAWNIPQQALNDLRARFIEGSCNLNKTPSHDKRLESNVQDLVRMEYAHRGAPLWRNNVGAAGAVRYGLANESERINLRFKSSDLIGITPRVIRAEDVGKTVGIFTAIEVKRGNWRYTGAPREVAQRRFIELVRSLGGIAKFENGAGL